jgi:hypothetical protein
VWKNNKCTAAVSFGSLISVSLTLVAGLVFAALLL